MKKLNQTTIKKKSRPIRILQFGECNFLRAFADWMIHTANDKNATDTSIAVVSPRFRENEGIKRLRQQDGLYHVILQGSENGKPKTETILVDSIAEALSPAVDFKGYENVVLSPSLRFVISNTTEAGIRYEKDDVLAETPVSFPGKVTSLLLQRFRHFAGDPDKGLIFLCCELIENNGKTLREIVKRHAREAELEESFLEWIDNACIFCDTLVDRIVPGFPSADIDEIKERIGYDDNLVVAGELFHVWAIGSDRYEVVRTELPLDSAGLNVLFLPDIRPFREKKVRILNGSHTGMVAIGLLLGHETVMEAFADRDLQEFVERMVSCEVIPEIEDDPTELETFAKSILLRFDNPFIRHMLKSIALNSLSKWEARNFPTVRDRWHRLGSLADFEIFTFAAMLYLYSPESEFTPDDNALHLDKIRKIFASWPDDCRRIVREITRSGIFLEDFDQSVAGFSDKAGDYLKLIKEVGMKNALESFLEAHPKDSCHE